MGEPLYEDVCSVILETGRDIEVLACRYGLAGKDYTPAQVIDVYKRQGGEQRLLAVAELYAVEFKRSSRANKIGSTVSRRKRRRCV